MFCHIRNWSILERWGGPGGPCLEMSVLFGVGGLALLSAPQAILHRPLLAVPLHGLIAHLVGWFWQALGTCRLCTPQWACSGHFKVVGTTETEEHWNEEEVRRACASASVSRTQEHRLASYRIRFLSPGEFCSYQVNSIELLWAICQTGNILDVVLFFFGLLLTVEDFDPIPLQSRKNSLFFRTANKEKNESISECLFPVVSWEEHFYRHQAALPAVANFPSLEN